MRGRDPKTGKFYRLPDIPQAITAGAVVLPSQAIDRLPRSADDWQTRAYRLARILGVLRFPVSFKARQVGRLKWQVIVDGDVLDDDRSAEAMKAITVGIGVREASERLAYNLELAGETWYSRAKDAWNVYAPTTPKLKEKLKAADINVQGMTPDPEDPSKPTSVIQAALGTAEQIRLMCQMSRGQDRNRLAQRGILLVPKEGQFPEGSDFQGDLETSMTAPIADEYAASAVVPLKVEYPADLIEKWRHLLIDSPYDDKLMDRIEKTIEQFAREIDSPPEMLLGNMDSNHWNAWLSSEENYRAYVEPRGESVGQVFAQAMMEATSGTVDIEVVPDASDLLAKQAVSEAFDALKLAVVGFKYVRQVMEVEEGDAPTDEEIALILQVTGNAPAGPQPQPQQADQAPPTQPSGNGAGPQPPVPSSNGVTAAVDPRARALERLSRQLTDMDIRLLSVLEGLAAMAVSHARESVKTDEVGADHAVKQEMGRLGAAWNREVTQARKALGTLGIDTTTPLWDQAQETSVHILTDEMSAFVTSTLERTDSEMPEVPTLVLRRVLAAAGGSGSATVAAITRNPAPTFQDPQGFAIGVLSVKDLKDQDVELVQWRFRYGPMHREVPFVEHKDVDGQFMTADGFTAEGWYPGDHKGCECWPDPVFRQASSPDEVAEEVDS